MTRQQIASAINRNIERINHRFDKGWIDQTARQRMLRVLRVWAGQKYACQEK